LNTAIAFCCAVDPSAVRVFFPAHSADPAGPAAAPVDPPVLSSLPHPLSARPKVVASSAMPAVLGFIVSRFPLTFGSNPPERMWRSWMATAWQVNAR
jgi:hypothetical protein